MIAFIEDHKVAHGVEPICRVLPIILSTFHAHAAIARDPDPASDRARQDVLDRKKIKDAFDDSGKRYGARKIWHELRRNNHDIARCTVERLMKAMGIKGVVRGQKPITTNPDTSRPCPDDKVRACRVKLNSPDRLNALCFTNAASTCRVNTSIRSNPTRSDREFPAAMPNQFRVSDFTCVSSWQGMVYVAFVINVFARKIVGWRVSTSMTTDFVLDALNQAICQRAPSGAGSLIHHSDRGSQYLAIKYTERLAEADIDPSVGSVGDSYDNALAESTIGLFKTEVIDFMEPWKSVGQVEWETLKWVNRYNTKRLHSKIGYITPQEAEQKHYQTWNTAEKAA